MADAPRTVEVWNGPLLTPSGRPLHRAVVPVFAVAPRNPLLSSGGTVLTRVTPDTNADGIWRAHLIPSSAYDRHDSYYVADESKYGGEQWAFRVPADRGPGPLRLVDLLIEPPPGGGPPPGVGEYLRRSEVGAPGGIPSLGADGRVPVAQLPADELVVDWWTGDGPPGVVVGASRGDLYIDDTAGVLYRLN